jgi:UDP-N-acetyl-2-amino-2-deoxyglucuronate dehydrogenase
MLGAAASAPIPQLRLVDILQEWYNPKQWVSTKPGQVQTYEYPRAGDAGAQAKARGCMADRLGIGIIGCGGIAGTHIKALAGLNRECGVVAVSDPIEAAARRRAGESGALAWYTDYRDLLADERVAAVTIGTPHYLHAPIAIAAARAGKHVYVEKPMAMTVGEAQEMLAAARQAGIRMTVSSELANPLHRFVRERVLPELGRIRSSYLLDFYFRGSAYYRSGSWRGKWATEGGGIFVNQAIYTWHIYTWLLGGVDLAYGYWTNLLHPEIEVEDMGYGMVRFRDGSQGKILATTCVAPPAGLRLLEIAGEHGTIFSATPWLRTVDFHLDDARRDEALRRDLQASLQALDGPPYAPWAEDDQTARIRAQLADFLAAIREDREPEVSAASGGEPIKVLDGFHWHGWRHAGKFREWFSANDGLAGLPQSGAQLTIEEAVAAGWTGGRALRELMAIVRSPSPQLTAPFLSAL